MCSSPGKSRHLTHRCCMAPVIWVSSTCRCLARAQKLQLPHIEAYARLGLAKFALQHNTAIAGPSSMEEEQHEAGTWMFCCCALLACALTCSTSTRPPSFTDWAIARISLEAQAP